MKVEDAAKAARLAEDLVTARALYERLTNPIAPVTVRVTLAGDELQASMQMKRCWLREMATIAELEIARIESALRDLDVMVPVPPPFQPPYYVER